MKHNTWQERSFALDRPLYIHQTSNPFRFSQDIEHSGWEHEERKVRPHDLHHQPTLA